MNTRQWPVRPEGVPFHVDPERERRQYVPLHIVRAPVVRRRSVLRSIAAALLSLIFGCRRPVTVDRLRYEVDNPDEHRREEKRRQRGHTDIFEVTP